MAAACAQIIKVREARGQEWATEQVMQCSTRLIGVTLNPKHDTHAQSLNPKP